MIFSFDLDNTLCSQNGSAYSEAKPFIDRIEIVNKLFNEGHTIIIDTGRGNSTGIDWHSVTKEQLKTWGLQYHVLIVGRKPKADFYIDDKGLNASDFFSNLNVKQ